MENNVEFLRRVATTADKDYALRKAAEECIELATVLLQQVNKPVKNYTREIEEEISHVSMRMLMISELFNKSNIQQQFDRKCENMKRWERDGNYRNL